MCAGFSTVLSALGSPPALAAPVHGPLLVGYRRSGRAWGGVQFSPATSGDIMSGDAKTLEPENFMKTKGVKCHFSSLEPENLLKNMGVPENHRDSKTWWQNVRRAGRYAGVPPERPHREAGYSFLQRIIPPQQKKMLEMKDEPTQLQNTKEIQNRHCVRRRSYLHTGCIGAAPHGSEPAAPRPAEPGARAILRPPLPRETGGAEQAAEKGLGPPVVAPASCRPLLEAKELPAGSRRYARPRSGFSAA